MCSILLTTRQDTSQPVTFQKSAHPVVVGAIGLAGTLMALTTPFAILRKMSVRLYRRARAAATFQTAFSLATILHHTISRKMFVHHSHPYHQSHQHQRLRAVRAVAGRGREKR